MALLRLTVKTIWARKVRFLLTSLAVLLGVAFTVAVFIFTDNLRSTFGDLATDIEAGFDYAVRSEVPFGERRNAAPVGLDLADQIAAVEGVSSVQPRVIEFGVIPITADGEAAGTRGPPIIGLNWEDQTPNPRLFIVDDGVSRAPTGAGEFVLDIDAALEDDFIVGERYMVATPAGLVEAELVGHFTFADPEENALPGSKLVAFTSAEAVRLFNDGAGYDDITFILAEGADAEASIAGVEALLPSGLRISSLEELQQDQADQFNEFIDRIQTFMLIFAFIILLVAAFVIYNVFSIIVSQRVKEVGLLRAIGGTGSQISATIVGEAVVVGAFATVAGLGLGALIARGLMALLSAFDFGPDTSGLPITSRTVIFAAVVGIGITVASALFPALKARRVSPMAALRDNVRLGTADVTPRPAIGAGVALVGAALTVTALGVAEWQWILALIPIAAFCVYWGVSRINPVAGRVAVLVLGLALLIVALVADYGVGALLSVLGAAALVMFLGVNAVSPLLARPVARTLGSPAAALSKPAQLAKENAARAPRRTASAAAALMIGLALVTTTTVVASSLKATFSDVLDEAVSADWAIWNGPGGPNAIGFPHELAERLEEVPQLEGVSAFRWAEEGFRTRSEGSSEFDEVHEVLAADLATLTDFIDPDFISVDESLFGPDALIIHEDVGEDRGLTIGDTLPSQFIDQSEKDLVIAGIYEDASMLEDWAIDLSLWNDGNKFTSTQDLFVTVNTASGVSEEEARAAIEAVTDDYPTVDALTKEEFKDEQEATIDQFLIIVNVMLFISIVLAIIGVAITLALSVFERTRELGLLRAVGMTRRQTRRMVRWEGIIVSLFGGLLGIVLGIVFGSAVVQIVPDSFLSETTIPVFSLVLYLVAAGVAGLFAALYPARRAARLNVLDAIAHQ